MGKERISGIKLSQETIIQQFKCRVKLKTYQDLTQIKKLNTAIVNWQI